ncbi:hypothetical protein [Absidia glauca]|uniref:Uncharacterized protein n=1 Tax=Absidia glauca TaxID=4829 RepID=A0A163V6Y6_ABSGL|nr:hypothetical protein [Absidia glauca]
MTRAYWNPWNGKSKSMACITRLPRRAPSPHRIAIIDNHHPGAHPPSSSNRALPSTTTTTRRYSPYP